jgi:hypothetical protein
MPSVEWDLKGLDMALLHHAAECLQDHIRADPESLSALTLLRAHGQTRALVVKLHPCLPLWEVHLVAK